MPLEWWFKCTHLLSFDIFSPAYHSALKESAYLCGATVKLQHNRRERMAAVTGLRQRPKAMGKWFLRQLLAKSSCWPAPVNWLWLAVSAHSWVWAMTSLEHLLPPLSLWVHKVNKKPVLGSCYKSFIGWYETKNDAISSKYGPPLYQK